MSFVAAAQVVLMMTNRLQFEPIMTDKSLNINLSRH